MPGPANRLVSVRFPLGGVSRRFDFQSQQPYTCASALNCWPVDRSTGRERGGVRPGVTELVDRAQAPYHWCKAVYLDTTVKTGIAVVWADGTYTSLDGVTWTQRISTNPGTNFATCAIYNSYIFQARGGGTTRQKTVVGGAEAALSNAGGGTAPTNCGIVWVHQDRLALAGDTSNPNRVYFSAVNDATNWNTATPDIGAAVTLGGSEGGFVGESVTAAIAHTTNISLIGSANSVYAVIGQPSLTSGRVERVSQNVGPLMQNAWCKGLDAQGNDNTYMFTADGLYVIPDGTLKPVRVSREKLPDDLVGVNPGAGDRVCIGYDQRWMGLYISVDYNTGTDVDWFYDLQSGGWWPIDYEAITPHLYASFPGLMTSTKSSILAIGSDGDVEQFNSASGEDFSSYVLLGPIMLAPNQEEGKLVGITAALGKDSANVTCKGYIGDTVEQAYQKWVASTPTFTCSQWSYSSTRYLNYWQFKQFSGRAMYLLIEDVGNDPWLMEEIVLELEGAQSLRRVGL
jgi:hypothetical protein